MKNNERFGVFVAVDDQYYGMIPVREVFRNFRIGELVEARVTKVRPDGKLDLSAVRRHICRWTRMQP